MGEDIYVAKIRFSARGTRKKTTNAVLINLNRVGTVTETIEAIEMCRRSGLGGCDLPPVRETEGDFLAGFAVVKGGGQINSGMACQSARIAKYKRLLGIGAELGKDAVLGS